MNTRQASIIEELQRETRTTIGDLAKRLGVSEMTIRRDTLALEEQGLVLRTYGGGVVLCPEPAALKAALATPANPRKAAIGELAAGLVSPGQTVMVDTGTTALEVARHLPADVGLTVATTSLPVAQELVDTPLNVLLLGGFVQKGTQTLFGALTEQMLAILHVDLFFTGSSGADSTEGFYAPDLLLYSQVRAMMRSAAQTVVVTESAKFGRKSFVRYASPEEVDCLVTDEGLSPADRQNLEEQGVRVLIATEEGQTERRLPA